ncbi:uncharacterized protein LOC112004615 [Quercus suber]|uniref:Uncharacterized protein n=1 Tax=Quercus suber TaxID=58331 RepID=A0AAW0L911_QUESU|nr:uncharacterized protein LOC112004615 [Quercus suber]XP_023892625.1 uncharacterized protein LOC112004615 [Quercus suber]
MAASLLCSNRILVLHNNSLTPTSTPTPRVENPLYPRSFLSQAKRNPRRGKFCVVALTESSKESSNKKTEEEEESKIPSWARPDSDEPPPWAQNESASQQQQQQGFEIPFYLYLLASAITAIAAIGSVFEYVNQRPVFGLLNSDSIFYAPLLGFFAFTGIPTSAFLWFKSVQAANKEAEEQDRKDGYL